MDSGALQEAAGMGAVDPGARQPASAADGHTQERNCLNCGCPLAGEFCHCCGQRAHVHRTIGAFFHDLAHGVLHFEGKIWRTLPLLAWKPGELTRRYIEGERARFVSPIALFLFAVFLMFAVVSATGSGNTDIGGTRDLGTIEQDARASIISLENARSAASTNPEEIARINEKIAEAKEELALVRELEQRGITGAAITRSKMDFDSRLPWLEEVYHRAKQNPDLLLYKMKSNSYKWSWAIIPLSVPFLWLLFPFSRSFRTYDHVVFVTYSLSFMTLLISLGTVFSALSADAIAMLLLFAGPLHIYRQLRDAYALDRRGAMWRTIALLVAAILVLSTFIVLMVGLGVMH